MNVNIGGISLESNGDDVFKVTYLVRSADGTEFLVSHTLTKNGIIVWAVQTDTSRFQDTGATLNPSIPNDGTVFRSDFGGYTFSGQGLCVSPKSWEDIASHRAQVMPEGNIVTYTVGEMCAMGVFTEANFNAVQFLKRTTELRLKIRFAEASAMREQMPAPNTISAQESRKMTREEEVVNDEGETLKKYVLYFEKVRERVEQDDFGAKMHSQLAHKHRTRELGSVVDSADTLVLGYTNGFFAGVWAIMEYSSTVLAHPSAPMAPVRQGGSAYESLVADKVEE